MSTGVEHHDETLYAPVSWWLLGAVFVLAVWWACFVATPAWVALVAGVVALAAVVTGLWSYGSVRIWTAPDGLHVGRAHLQWPHVGPAVALDAAATKQLLGVEADARAYLVVRSYCPRAVRVGVDDLQDPAPYWLVSTRRPELLVASLGRRRVPD